MATNPGQDSVRPSTPSLAGAFKRGAGLQGLSLAQPETAPEAIDLTSESVVEQAVAPPDPTVPEPGAPDPVPTTRPSQQRRSGSRASTTRSQPRKRSSREAERSALDPAAREQTAIWVEISLRNRLKAHRTATNMDATNAVLAALRAADRDALLSAFGHNLGSGDDNDPFAPIPATRVQHSDATTQITLRPTARALAAIDELAKEVGAPNRSALIAAVLHSYLPTDDG